MEQKAVARRETDIQLSPAEVVAGATEQAKLLMTIVRQTKCYQEIAGEMYLQVEAWETIGAFNYTHAETESIIPIIKDNETIGYQARVQLWKNGVVVGGAIMPCYFTENCCKGKEGDAKHKASMSAAQTFATSKAYRMNFSYVAILAGFQPLPAEEVTDDMKGPMDKSQHYCKLHDTAFFKRGKMKSYAHPIEGTDEWCHEHKKAEKEKIEPDVKQAEKDTEELFPPDTGNAKATSVKPKAKGAEPAQTTALADPLPGQPEPETPGEEVGFIDDASMEWLGESLKTLQDKKLDAWTNANVLSYLNKITGTKSKSVSEAATKLSKEQANDFLKKVQETLDMA